MEYWRFAKYILKTIQSSQNKTKRKYIKLLNTQDFSEMVQ